MSIRRSLLLLISYPTLYWIINHIRQFVIISSFPSIKIHLINTKPNLRKRHHSPNKYLKIESISMPGSMPITWLIPIHPFFLLWRFSLRIRIIITKWSGQYRYHHRLPFKTNFVIIYNPNTFAPRNTRFVTRCIIAELSTLKLTLGNSQIEYDWYLIERSDIAIVSFRLDLFLEKNAYFGY